MTIAAAATLKILYVDDDCDDVFFLKESFQSSGLEVELICSNNGEDAVQLLHSLGSENLPDLIVLDLNMPKWDGRQTLVYLKENPVFAQIPVVILSTSENKADRQACSSLGAVLYIQKPNQFDGYNDVINRLVGVAENKM